MTEPTTVEPVEVEGTAVELYEQPQAPTNLFQTDDPVEVISQATRVADALKSVIRDRRLFETIQGKEHVKVEGWQLLGSMLGVTAVCVGTEQVDGGWKATVEARAADGRVIGRADAVCTKHEKRGPWKSADEYARLSMAQTRATSKALKGPLGFVVSLAGYATTPAEEMTFAASDPEPQKPQPKLLDDAAVRIVLNAITEAKPGTERLRQELVGLGVQNVPDGQITKGTIQGLSERQAQELVEWCQGLAG